MLQKRFAKGLIGGFSKEFLFEVATGKGLFKLVPIIIGRRDDETLIRQKLSRHPGTRVDHIGINKEACLHPVNQ